jgi:hypothetical protein
MGGDISIPDLSKPNWLDKYQDGGPKPMSWQEYLKYMGADDAELKSINPKDYLLWEEDQHTLLKDLDPEKAKTAKAAKINFYDKSARHIPHESNLLKDVYASRKADLIDTYNLLYFNNDKQDYSGSPGNVTKWENGEDVFYPGKFAIENEGDESLTAQEILNRTKTNYSLPIQDYASQRMKKRPNYADTKIPYTRVYPRTMLMDYNNPSADFNAGIEYINDPRYVDVTENFYSDPPSARPMSFFPAPSYNYANAPKRYDEKGNEVINKSDVPKIKPNTYYDFPGSNTEMIYNEKLRLNNITKENIRNIKTIDPTGNIGDIDYNTPAAKKYINDPWFYYGKERNDGDPYCVNCDKLSGSEHSQDKLFDYFKFAPQSPSSNLWWMKTFGLKPPRPVFLNQNLTKSGQVQIGWDVWDPKRKQWKAEYFDSDEINKRREDVKVPKDGGQDVNFRTGVIHDLTPVNKDKEAVPVKKKIEVPPGMKTGGWLDKYQDGREVSSKYDLMRVDQPTAVAASTNVVVPNIVNAPKRAATVKPEVPKYTNPPTKSKKENYPPKNYSKISLRPGVSGSTVTVFVDPKTGEEWTSPEQQAAQEEYNELSRSNNVDRIGTAILAGSLAAPVVAPLVKTALPYLNAPAVLPYFGEVPWLTAGNVLGAAGATDAIVNRLPEIPGQISRGEYKDAATNAIMGALDVSGANMVSPLLKSFRAAKQLPGSPNSVSEIPKSIKTKRPMLNTSQEPYSKTYPELSPRYKIEKSNFDTESVFWTDYNKREHGIDYDRPIPRFYDPTVHPPEFHPSVMKYEKPWTPEELEEIAAKKAAAERIKSHLKTVPFEQRRFDTQSRITPTSSLPGSPNAPIVNNVSTKPAVSTDMGSLSGMAGDFGDIYNDPRYAEYNRLFREGIKHNLLPESSSLQGQELLTEFKKRIRTPEGMKRLKALGITDPVKFDDYVLKEINNSLAYHKDSPFHREYIGLHKDMPGDIAKKITRHELEHAVQRVLRRPGEFNPTTNETLLNPGLTEIDDILNDLDFVGTPSETFTPRKLSEEPIPFPSNEELFSDQQRNLDYFVHGSNGKEKSAFLAEIQQSLLDEGLIDDVYETITPEKVEEAYNLYMSNTSPNKYKLRLFEISRPTPDNFNKMAKGLNKMLTIIPTIGIGAGALQKEKDGGWLNRYQDGGSRNMPLGLPLREQNPYLVPEYNQPMANGYILPDPNRPQLMNTGATEYKYSYGVDDRDVQVPSVVAGQYIGDNAFDRYMISGEEFKPMADPSSYSKFYDMIEKLGLMKQKKGGVKSQGEGYYDYINGYSGIFANGGTKSKEKSWLNKYK